MDQGKPGGDSELCAGPRPHGVHWQVAVACEMYLFCVFAMLKSFLYAFVTVLNTIQYIVRRTCASAMWQRQRQQPDTRTLSLPAKVKLVAGSHLFWLVAFCWAPPVPPPEHSTPSGQQSLAAAASTSCSSIFAASGNLHYLHRASSCQREKGCANRHG